MKQQDFMEWLRERISDFDLYWAVRRATSDDKTKDIYWPNKMDLPEWQEQFGAWIDIEDENNDTR